MELTLLDVDSDGHAPIHIVRQLFQVIVQPEEILVCLSKCSGVTPNSLRKCSPSSV